MRHWTLNPLLVGYAAFYILFSPGGAVAQQETCCETRSESRVMEAVVAELSTEMHLEVEALRGWKFKHPVDVGLFTCEEVRAFMQGDEDDEAVWGEEQRAECALKLIGVIPSGCDPTKQFEEAMMAFVPDGIYDHENKALRLVNDEDFDPSSLGTRITLAHELAHALDDQHFDLAELDKKGGGTSDMNQVWGAIIEGSGVTMQERYKIKAKASGRFDLQKLDQSDKEEMAQMQPLFEATPYVASFMARFPCGIRFLQQGDFLNMMALFMGSQDPGSIGETLQTVVTDFPRSFEQVLHPEKYWESEWCDEPVVLCDETVQEMLSAFGLHIVFRDTLGELFCAILSSPEDRTVNPMAMTLPGYWSNEGATGWGGDRLFLLAREKVDENALQPPEELLAIWFTQWDSPDDCNEFLIQYEAHRTLPDRDVIRLGDLGAVFLYTFPATLRNSLEQRLQSAPPDCSRNGTAWSWTCPDSDHAGKLQ